MNTVVNFIKLLAVIIIVVMAMGFFGIVNVMAAGENDFHRYNPVGCLPYTRGMVTSHQALSLTHSGCTGTSEVMEGSAAEVNTEPVYCPAESMPLFTEELYYSHTFAIPANMRVTGALLYDNDGDTAWTLNGESLPFTGQHGYAFVTVPDADIMTFARNGDSAHLNICVELE